MKARSHRQSPGAYYARLVFALRDVCFRMLNLNAKCFVLPSSCYGNVAVNMNKRKREHISIEINFVYSV